MSYLRIAHRGAAGTRPELTRPAFERALEIGVDMIELDVQLTRDGRLVVLHDRQLGRTLAGEGPVRERTLAELQALDAGSWFDARWAGASVPSLDEVLAWTAGRAELNVEIKSPPADWTATAEALLVLLSAAGRLERTIISSFQMGALAEVRARSRAARIGVLWQTTDFDPMWIEAQSLEAIAVHPLWSLVDEALIAEARRQNRQVMVWTVNDPDAMAELIRIGVSGIISDFPERLPRR
ncbi:glycerophosphodiester phosphodiesterase [bacterium]|nr:glycerophosphodiester phosphodiesterase [bacterium]